jgi:hypothetical protein
MWSPDGRWIVWTRGKQLWITDSTGTDARPLTSVAAKQFEYALAWAEDEQEVMYAASDGGPDYELRVIRLDGSGQRRDPSGIVSGFPQGMSLSLDGAHLFQSLWALGSGFAVMEHRGGRRVRTVIVRPTSSVGQIVIGPGEKFVVFDHPDPEPVEFLTVARPAKGP